MAQACRRFDSRVTVIEGGPRIMSREDPDVADEIQRILGGEGIEFQAAAETLAVHGRSGEEVSLAVHTSAGLVLGRIRRRFPWLELIWADGGYNAGRSRWPWPTCRCCAWRAFKRRHDMNGFVVLPRRWVVERTFSWFGRNGPLAEDFENLAGTLETFVTLAVIPARQDVGS